MRFLRKIYRETAALISKMFISGLPVRYRGYWLFSPMVHGMNNSGYYIEAEEFMINSMKDAVLRKPDATVLDIGANVGLLLTQLRAFSEDCRYVGIEPNVGNCFYCNILIEKNNFSNAQVYPLALGADTSVAKLILKKSRKNDPGAYVSDNAIQHNLPDKYHELPISVMKGDEFAVHSDLGKVSFIKIDVEGFETEVISGLSNTIVAHRPDILCEVVPESSSFIKEFLRQYHYAPFSFNDDNAPEPLAWEENMPFGNYLFKPIS